MSHHWRSVTAAVALLLFTACGCHFQTGSYDGYAEAAEQGMRQLRSLYAEQKFPELYAMVAPELHQNQSLDQFVTAMANTRAVLGGFKSGSLAARACLPNQVRLIYLSQFENGPATELVTWVIRDGRPTLLGYQFERSHLQVPQAPDTCIRKRPV